MSFAATNPNTTFQVAAQAMPVPFLSPAGADPKPRRRRPTQLARGQEGAKPARKTKADECSDELSDRDLTISLLSRCLSLTAAARATETLLARYGCYADAVAAPLHELRAIPEVGNIAASLLKCVHSSVARLASIPLRQAPVLSNWAKLSAYLNVCMGHERTEFCRVLFLNAKNHLISDQIVSEGDVRSVPVPVRTVTRKALELGATALILVHNHPSGDPTPSEEDFIMTEQVKNAISLFGIVLHDHIIVGNSECFSLKSRAYLPSSCTRETGAQEAA